MSRIRTVQRRTIPVHFVAHPDEADMIRRAAFKARLSVATFTREAAIRSARDLIQSDQADQTDQNAA